MEQKYTPPSLIALPPTENRNDLNSLAFPCFASVEYPVMYPWLIADADVTLQEALEIAMYYLESTGQAFPFSKTEKACAQIILMAWRAGTKHRIKLADYAIVAVEQKMPPPLESFYPRAG
jgi:hypothetical protein